MEEIYTVYWPNGTIQSHSTVKAAEGYIDWMDLGDPTTWRLPMHEFFIQMIDVMDLHESYVTIRRGE